MGPVGLDDAYQPVRGLGNIIVFYHMIVRSHKAQLTFGGLKTGSDLFVGLRATMADQNPS